MNQSNPFNNVKLLSETSSSCLEDVAATLNYLPENLLISWALYVGKIFKTFPPSQQSEAYGPRFFIFLALLQISVYHQSNLCSATPGQCIDLCHHFFYFYIRRNIYAPLCTSPANVLLDDTVKAPPLIFPVTDFLTHVSSCTPVQGCFTSQNSLQFIPFLHHMADFWDILAGSSSAKSPQFSTPIIQLQYTLVRSFPRVS